MECKDSGCGNRSGSRRELSTWKTCTSQRENIHDDPDLSFPNPSISLSTPVSSNHLYVISACVLPSRFSRSFKSPVLPLYRSPVFISLSLSCWPMAANTVRHSRQLLQHCPILRMRKWSLYIYFYNIFFSPCLFT